MSNHPIVHIEFAAIDLEKSGKFYTDLFGWQITPMPEYNYAGFETGSGLGGGITPLSEDYPVGTVIFYVDTDDIEATLAKAEALGGKTFMPKTEVPGMGWMAWFSIRPGPRLAWMDGDV